MRKGTAVALVFTFVLGLVAFAGEEACKGEKACPGEKVTKLLADWKAVAEAQKTSCPIEREKVNAEFAAVAKTCPIGSRMGETLGFVRGVLLVTFSDNEACGKSCPAAQAEKTDSTATAGVKESKNEPCTEVSKALAARVKLGRDLHELASFAAASFSSLSGSTCLKEKEGAVNASVLQGGKSACCEAACAASRKDLTTKAEALKASWDKVGGEFIAMCPQKKKELFASVKSLGERSKALCLLPETVLALADGVEALEAIDAKLNEYGKAHPDQLKDVSEEAKKRFQEESKLLHETGEVLRRVRKAAASQGGGCPEKGEKTEVSSKA